MDKISSKILKKTTKKASSNTLKLCISAVIIALYMVVMHATQSFAFGAYQIRIATSFYALSYLFPFLILPMGLSNFLANLLGGFGLVDMIGGAFVGILTSGLVYLVRKMNLSRLLIIPIIILGPGLIVPLWLSSFTGIPYLALVLSLCIGQILPAASGYFLIKLLYGREIIKI